MDSNSGMGGELGGATGEAPSAVPSQSEEDAAERARLVQQLADARAAAGVAPPEVAAMGPVELPPAASATPVAPESIPFPGVAPQATTPIAPEVNFNEPMQPGDTVTQTPDGTVFHRPGNDPIPFPTPETIVRKNPGEPRKSRAEIAAMREAEQATQIVDYYLPITGEWVKVRDLPFTDRVMLLGMPHDIRAEFDEAFQDERVRKVATEGIASIQSFEDSLAILDKADVMTTAVAIAGFVDPPLVRTEAELAQTPGAWLVSDLHPEELLAFLTWVQRNRMVERMGAATAANAFPGAGVGSPPSGTASD